MSIQGIFKIQIISEIYNYIADLEAKTKRSFSQNYLFQNDTNEFSSSIAHSYLKSLEKLL